MKALFLMLAMVIYILSSSYTYSHPINTDLAIRNIKINSDFKGVDLLIFGALDIKGDVVILVHGPRRSIVINKKEKKYAFWINGKREKLDNIKQFYAVSSSKELSDIANYETLKLMRIDDLSFTQDQELNDAFKKMKRKKKLYTQQIGIDIINEKLFRSNIEFPSDIPQGRYIIEILLFYNQSLFGIQTIPLLVSRTGIESFIFDMHDFHPFLYAISSVLGALLIGWISSIIKRKQYSRK